jgi:DNA-directed RNA polymerase subunit RPC12/RpoP
MPIKVHCGSCNASFKAKDELAGRRVKCPKCQSPVIIPAAPAAPKKPVAPARQANPLLDLLDEEDVRSVARGPICGNCGVEVKHGTVICIECGFNQETGDRLTTEASDDIDSGGNMSGADQIMAKAERDIEDIPISTDEDDFGDGAESYLIALVAAFFGAILLGICMAVILSMEQLSLLMAPAGISFIASILLYVGMGAWLSIVAFQAATGHGIGCVASGGLYCPIFGFMQGKTLLLPAIVMLVAMFMMLATGLYVSWYGWAPTAS